MKTIVLSVAVTWCALGLAGCKSAYETELPFDPGDESQMRAFTYEIREIPGDEKEDILAYIGRTRPAGGSGRYDFPGMTARQALEKQRIWEKAEAERQRIAEEEEAKRLKAEEEKKAANEARQREMLDLCGVTLVKKSVGKSPSLRGMVQRTFDLELRLSNKGTRDIAEIRGKIEFKNSAGDLLKEIMLKAEEVIKPGKAASWEGRLGYSLSKPSDKLLEEIAIKDLTVVWLPEAIRFADGSKITLE